jgi:TPR repeat protein
VIFAGRVGDAQAHNNLGIMYRDGLGVQRDYDEAFKLVGFAAAQGLAEAEYNLADLYGQPGARQDLNAFLFWVRSAASHGYTPAQKFVGKPPLTKPSQNLRTSRLEVGLKKGGRHICGAPPHLWRLNS